MEDPDAPDAPFEANETEETKAEDDDAPVPASEESKAAGKPKAD